MEPQDRTAICPHIHSLSSVRVAGYLPVISPQASQDVGFAAAFRRIPSQLRVALVEHELDDAGILERFSRKPIALLGILGTDTSTAQLVTGIATGRWRWNFTLRLYSIRYWVPFSSCIVPFLMLTGVRGQRRLTKKMEDRSNTSSGGRWMEVASIEDILDPIKPVFPRFCTFSEIFTTSRKIEVRVRKFETSPLVSAHPS